MTNRRALPGTATITAVVLLIALAGSGCRSGSGTGGSGSGGTLSVFAASSLTEAFTEIGTAFEQQHPDTKVALTTGASSTLRTQLEQGARADVFASADEAQMQRARDAGVTDGAAVVFTRNRLALIVPAANPAQITTPADLARPGIRLALAGSAVPVGAYARDMLARFAAAPGAGADFERRALANVRSEEANVRAVVTRVQLGEADAGIVYVTDITPAAAKDLRVISIPDAVNPIAAYPIALVKGARHAAAGRAFIAFVQSPAGQVILARYGFIGESAARTATMTATVAP